MSLILEERKRSEKNVVPLPSMCVAFSFAVQIFSIQYAPFVTVKNKVFGRISPLPFLGKQGDALCSRFYYSKAFGANPF